MLSLSISIYCIAYSFWGIYSAAAPSLPGMIFSILENSHSCRKKGDSTNTRIKNKKIKKKPRGERWAMITLLTLLQRGQALRVLSQRWMQSKWKTWPQVPHAILNPGCSVSPIKNQIRERLEEEKKETAAMNHRRTQNKEHWERTKLPRMSYNYTLYTKETYQ